METSRFERFPQLFWGMVALALGLVLAAALAGSAIRSVRSADDEIQVTGSAKRQIRSDMAGWHVSSSVQAPTIQQALTELNENGRQIREFIRRNALADSLVSVDPVSISPVYRVLETGQTTDELLGYRLSQGFYVESRDVNAVTALSQRSSELLALGVPVQAGNPSYLYTKLAEVRTEMLAAATADARRRAEAIATSVGSDVGAVRSARMGVFQITPPNSTEVSDSGINDTSSLEKDITAVVRVTFAVK